MKIFVLIRENEAEAHTTLTSLAESVKVCVKTVKRYLNESKEVNGCKVYETTLTKNKRLKREFKA